MRPIAHTNGHDAPRLIDEAIPLVGAVPDDVVAILQNLIRQPVIANKLPDVLHHVQLRAFCGQRHLAREVPADLIEQQHRMPARADHPTDLGQVEVHARGVAERQDQGSAFAFQRADCVENISGRVALIQRRQAAGAAPIPTADNIVFCPTLASS